jgi:hypothetical protein
MQIYIAFPVLRQSIHVAVAMAVARFLAARAEEMVL